MYKIRNSFLALALALLAAAPASAVTLINGSLTGPIANGSPLGPSPNNALPDGWFSFLGNPDTMDENNNIGLATGTVPFNTVPSGPSPDGGTWVGFGNDRFNSFDEIFGQTVTGFQVGETYTVSWYAANFGADLTTLGDQCFCESNSVAVAVDGNIIGVGDNLESGADWMLQSVNFAATASTQTILFGLLENGPSYLSIDGITVAAINPVPVPASAALLVSAFGALAFARRRRKT